MTKFERVLCNIIEKHKEKKEVKITKLSHGVNYSNNGGVHVEYKYLSQSINKSDNEGSIFISTSRIIEELINNGILLS